MTGRVDPALLRLSAKGADLIAEREGLKTEAYLDSRGIITIGIGHTSAAGHPPVHEGMTITEEQAMLIFANDNKRFRKEVIRHILAPLYQHEFDALASFLFNLGSPQFLGSTALERLNRKDYAGCAEAMLWWAKPPEIIPRRKAEVEQFLHGHYVARVP